MMFAFTCEKNIGPTTGTYTFMPADKIASFTRKNGCEGKVGVKYVLNTPPYTQYKWSNYWGRLVKA